MSEQLTRVLDKLQSVQKRGTEYRARCPAHEDRTNSLSVSQRAANILIHCFAGCSPASIVERLGLSLSDLYVDSCRSEHSPRIVATYDYADEAGNLLYQTVRLEPGRDGKKKDFFQRRPNSRGGWINNLKGVRRVLYWLPELLESRPEKTIWIVEGEKDVDRLRTLGLIATCNVGGAGKWRSEYNEYFRGRKVVIIPDNDEAGRKHAGDVANHLRGIAL
jgi:putative DNA primase/helicase